MLRVDRWRSRAPRRASSFATLLLMAEGVAPSERAALLKLPVSTDRTKASRPAVFSIRVVILRSSRNRYCSKYRLPLPSGQEYSQSSSVWRQARDDADDAGDECRLRDADWRAGGALTRTQRLTGCGAGWRWC